ncbi:MAG TPA: glycosyltransferase family 4 protein [Edaphobacter sp.]|nr:glycosyltransferase family 4 protein [Edaphobacter sp.]
MLRALAEEHDFTVFAVEFHNPRPDRIKWVRVPVPTRPLALLFIAFHLLAPLLYFLHKFRTGSRFDLIQMVESNLSFGAICYSHFCHRSYLRHHWQEGRPTGLRGYLRWLDHWLHATLEALVFRRAQRIVVPSQGLARELQREFSFTSTKITVLPNAVDVEQFRRPEQFNRSEFRRMLNLNDGDIMFLFVALGQFERKGLPLLMAALKRLGSKTANIIVVGGEQDLVEKYRALAVAQGIEANIRFVGMQSDVRAYLWAADAFAFPSSYETFSLVAFEAAVASLPLIAPALNGIEEILQDGRNGIVVRRAVEEITAALKRFLALSQESRDSMGKQAHAAAATYDEARFICNWRGLYRHWVSPAQVHAALATSPYVHAE